jgi:hypothetical protein
VWLFAWRCPLPSSSSSLSWPLSRPILSPMLSREWTRSHQQFKAVTADIQRDVYTAVIDDHEKDMGTIKAKRDKSHDTRMLIEFTSPDVKTIALDGTSASVYTPTLKTVQVVDIKKGLVDQFLLLGFGASSADLKETLRCYFCGNGKTGERNHLASSADPQVEG